MVRHEEFSYAAQGFGAAIYAQLFIPDGEPRGVLQIAHGVNEYSGRYREFALFLAERGFIVAANDHAGHGRSSSDAYPLGYFAPRHGYKCALADMRTLYKTVSLRYPDAPYFLFGHSMGSFFAENYLSVYDDDLAGVILSGAGRQPRTVLLTGRVLASLIMLFKGRDYKSRLMVGLCFGGYNKKFDAATRLPVWLSRDGQIAAAYAADPYCRFRPAAEMIRQIFIAMADKDKRRHLRRVKKAQPLLFVSGADDPVGGFGSGVSRIFSRYCKRGLTDVSLLLYPEGRHEMLNELNKRQVYDDILQWLEERV
ncbi:MAG: alpha/beta hydrolase [Bacillota bacterium]|nr:alpha/beta hydrolase [Bacillota bacterium]